MHYLFIYLLIGIIMYFLRFRFRNVEQIRAKMLEGLKRYKGVDVDPSTIKDSQILILQFSYLFLWFLVIPLWIITAITKMKKS